MAPSTHLSPQLAFMCRLREEAKVSAPEDSRQLRTSLPGQGCDWLVPKEQALISHGFGGRQVKIKACPLVPGGPWTLQPLGQAWGTSGPQAAVKNRLFWPCQGSHRWDLNFSKSTAGCFKLIILCGP